MQTGYSLITVGNLIHDITASPFSRGQTWKQERSLAFVHAVLRGEPSQSLTFVNHPGQLSCDQDPYLLDGHARLGALMAVARGESSIAARVRDLVLLCNFVTISPDTWVETTQRLRCTLNNSTIAISPADTARALGRMPQHEDSVANLAERVLVCRSPHDPSVPGRIAAALRTIHAAISPDGLPLAPDLFAPPGRRHRARGHQALTSLLVAASTPRPAARGEHSTIAVNIEQLVKRIDALPPRLAAVLGTGQHCANAACSWLPSAKLLDYGVVGARRDKWWVSLTAFLEACAERPSHWGEFLATAGTVARNRYASRALVHLELNKLSVHLRDGLAEGDALCSVRGPCCPSTTLLAP